MGFKKISVESIYQHYIGLAKKFVWLFHIIEKPEWTFSSTQYLREWTWSGLLTFKSHLWVMERLGLPSFISLCLSSSSVKWRWYVQNLPSRVVVRIKQVNIRKVLRGVSNQALTKYKHHIKLLRTYCVSGTELGVWIQIWENSSMVCLMKLTAWQEDRYLWMCHLEAWTFASMISAVQERWWFQESV